MNGYSHLSPLTRISNEVLDLFIQPLDKQTLLAICTGVGKRISSIATRHLYRSITIERDTRILLDCLATLSTDEKRAELVRSLTVVWWFQGNHNGCILLEDYAVQLKALLKCVKRLTHLDLQLCPGDKLGNLVDSGYLFNLSSFSTTAYMDNSFNDFLMCQLNLKQLWLGCLHSDGFLKLSLSQVKVLHWGSDASPRIIEVALQLWPTLEEIDGDITKDDWRWEEVIKKLASFVGSVSLRIPVDVHAHVLVTITAQLFSLGPASSRVRVGVLFNVFLPLLNDQRPSKCIAIGTTEQTTA
ncbi:hypothetical protein Hypma_010939 [Hypsizygus marmoreus]|uniref:F-box domain-containing protein n=1 Tax=Hypsizygus marmoreus TaxID=39966 RepID=A0A369JN33_HYPMA|nr:hypothetical protein Hypma_010939 [Hypsizygus marmoreus]